MPIPLYVTPPASSAVGSGLGEIVVANEAALAGIGGNDGQFAFVISHRSLWVASQASALALSAGTVVANPFGGRWIRTPYSDPSWRLGITDVYIDPSNVTGIASDENKGIHNAPQVGAARAPLLHWQELSRRWDRRNLITTGDLVGLTIQVHVLSDEPGASAASDPWDIDGLAGIDTYLRLLGEASAAVLGPVALDAVGGWTPQNPAVPAPGGTAAQIKIGATVWGPYIGKRVRRTSDGSVAYVLLDLGGGNARISQPQLPNEPLFFAFPVNVAWANGDVVVVEDLVKVNAGRVSWGDQGSALGFAGQINLADVEAMNVSGADIGFEPDMRDSLSAFVVYQSRFLKPVYQDAAIILNGSCLSGAQFIGQGVGAGAMYGGAIVNAPIVGAEIARAGKQFFNFGALDYDVYVQGAPVLTRGDCVCGTFSVWDAPAGAINPGGHAILVGGPPNAGAGQSSLALRSGNPVFGNGSVGVGVRVAAGSQISAYQTLPNITGAVGDLQLANSLTGWYFFNGAYAPVGAGIALSWANVALAQPAGFGGSAHEPQQQAHVNQAAAT